jgi:ATP-dependent exoDNAse (exonuclease V) beta subunit
MITDQQARLEALNTQRSFIVQAPAGSGKTELLTQRFLKLLTTVKSPEEIIAITFTRKAAAQMRQRILSALLLAHEGIVPDEPHKQLTFKLASQALERDKQLNWHIIDNPNRLRVLTIDALAGFLSAQIPILAGFGSKPQITDNAGLLYEEAARELVSTITQDNPWKEHIETLLLHLDNQAARVIDLLCSILSKREQWLPHILAYHGNSELLHEHLEQGLINIVDEIIDSASHVLGSHLDELVTLGQHAAKNLSDAGNTSHPILKLLTIDYLATDHHHIEQWQALAELLLTKSGGLRKKIDKNIGFLPKTPEKECLSALLALFADDEPLLNTLLDLQYCPNTSYPASQKAMIEALTQLLPILYAQLRLCFEQHNVIDFVELNLAALRALGEEDEPTDLALYLDYQIQHLLIDEFQDTSITQYTLLKRLTRGWEPDDGRSLFLVGDPMQSIYRFRDAEVGLFIRAQAQPINGLSLTKLTLQNNYRSDKKIVEWINETFHSLFPKQAQIIQGAVPYSPSIPTQNYSDCGIYFHGLVEQDKKAEAQVLVNSISQLVKNNPDDTLAILVRSRNHLQEIIPLLHARKLNFQAVDLETLIQCSEIQDLLTLTRILLHREDRIAWYALLRSPVCGLTLADLHTLSQLPKQFSLWQHIQEQPQLSNDGMLRLQRLQPSLALYFNEQFRKPFELALKGLWRALGFEEILSIQQQNNCNDFFQLIADLASTDNTINIDELTQKLRKTYIKPQQASSKLSIMTIHKSKGLEFDHVILPGLNAKSAADKHELMLWLEKPNEQRSIDLILAPIKHASKDNDRIYRYLQRIEKCKLDFESARLLYVAATRAKKSLHLSACLATNKKDEAQFKPNSFGAMLAHEFLKNLNHDESPTPTNHQQDIPPLMRVKADWQPQLICPTQLTTLADNPLPEPDNPTQRIIGTVIHELLANSALRTLEFATYRLQQYGICKQLLTQALDKIQITLINIQTDSRAKWIFDSTHQFSQYEYPVTTVIKGKVRHLIIDRTFVEDETRWIVDYKTATPHDETMEHFLQRELELYRQQLETYKQAIQGLDQRTIRCGLYFPVCKGWIEASLPISI